MTASASSGSAGKPWTLTRRSGSGAAPAPMPDRVHARHGAGRHVRGRWSASGEGPEFETVAMFGANLDIYDLEPITEANYLCNRLGLDTISAGGTIAALMEIFGIARAKAPAARTEGERALMADVAEFARACGAAEPDGPDGRRAGAGVRERAGARPARRAPWPAAKAGSGARSRRGRGGWPSATATPRRR